MHINAINNSYNNGCQNNKNQNFGRLIKDKSVLPILNNMSAEDKIEFKKIEKRLSKTKFWDMKISAIGNKFDELKFHFINKKNRHGVITDGIYPYRKKDNTISFYSIIYGAENISENLVEDLKFSSPKRAEKVYENYNENKRMVINKRFQLTPIESIKSKAIELNMLEKGYRNIHKNSKLFESTDKQTKNFVGNDLHK